MKKLVICSLLLLPLVGWGQDVISQFPGHKQTEYFDFYYRGESPKIPEIARFADGFVRLLNRDFFKAEFDYPIRVLVLEDRAQFQQFLIRQLHMADPPNFGVYLGRYKMFVTYEDSGLGTFAHEILHPLVEHNLAATIRLGGAAAPPYRYYLVGQSCRSAHSNSGAARTLQTFFEFDRQA